MAVWFWSAKLNSLVSNCVVLRRYLMLMVWYETIVCSVLYQWRNHSIFLNHWYMFTIFCPIRENIRHATSSKTSPAMPHGDCPEKFDCVIKHIVVMSKLSFIFSTDGLVLCLLYLQSIWDSFYKLSMGSQFKYLKNKYELFLPQSFYVCVKFPIILKYVLTGSGSIRIRVKISIRVI